MSRVSTAALLITLLTPALVMGQSSPSPAVLPSSSTPASPSASVVEDSTTEEVPPEEEDAWDEARLNLNDHAEDYVGISDEYGTSYDRESAVYRAAPPIRYNRVEGLVVGFQRDPLSLRDSDDTARIYGQLDYAFALKELRYAIGVESRVHRTEETGLKLGVAYQKQTLTPDRWKTSHAENSLGSFGFEYDFFDYYEAEGLSIYAVQALPHTLRLTAGFRSEMHGPLRLNTRWSLFGAGTFRPNPAAETGRLQAGFASLEGGHVRDRDDLPTGTAFRLGATVGEPFGGDLHVNRYEADGRVFLPLSEDTRLGLRLRGGYATSPTPVQMQFSLGGIGSLRSYDQNAFRGSRMLLGNAEYIIDGATLDDDFLDDLFLIGLFDAGWVGGPGDRVRVGDVMPSAGFGIGLDERQVRLDVSWPLREGRHSGSRPAIWLRITPNF